MSIPKIIHAGIFGGWKLSPLNESCMESWARLLPDYELKWWNDSNVPEEFFAEAIRTKPINAHNYLKWWALSQFGGVFMDGDIEVIQPLDLSHNCFIGWQRDDIPDNAVNTAILGAIPGHPFINECLARVKALGPSYNWPVALGCGIPTDVLREHGLQGLNQEQMVADIMVYDKERFYPWRWDQVPNVYSITDRTFAIHHWEGTWSK